MMMFVNLIWAWGHPEVYILMLPAFGIFSEVFSTFSGKPLFGYRSMVMATMAHLLDLLHWCGCITSSRWARAPTSTHFSASRRASSRSPTGVKIFNWLFTMYGGRVRYATPMLWSLAFMVTFVLGGMTGVLLAVPPADFSLHDSLFLVAHFHNVIIGGVLFGCFAGVLLLVPEGLRFPAARRLGQGCVLVLAHWILRDFFSALCRRAARHDATPAAL